jgi:hypothetical protein
MQFELGYRAVYCRSNNFDGEIMLTKNTVTISNFEWEFKDDKLYFNFIIGGDYSHCEFVIKSILEVDSDLSLKELFAELDEVIKTRIISFSDNSRQFSNDSYVILMKDTKN